MFTGSRLGLTLSLLLAVVTLVGSLNARTALAAAGAYPGGQSLDSIMLGQVLAAPPAIALSYGTSYVALNGTTTLTLTITNPDPSGSLVGISVTDILPAGLVVVGQDQVSPGTCTGTITAVEGSSEIDVSGVAVPAQSNCTVNVTVKGTQVGYTHNTSGIITSDNSEDGTTSNSATLAVGLALVVTPADNLKTSEAGGTATFYVSLNAEPEGTVVVGITSNNKAEGTVYQVDPCIVRNCFALEGEAGKQPNKADADDYMYFSTYNWNTPLQVVIKGQDDLAADGPQNYTVTVDPSFSDGNDPYFFQAPSVAVNLVNQDNDTAGLVVEPSSGLITSEAGGTASFSVQLSSQPTETVAVKLTSSNAAEGTVKVGPPPPPPFNPDGTPVKNRPNSPDTLYFTSDNWNVAQTAIITGIDDSVVDGDQAYTISLDPGGSTDLVYKLLQSYTVYATNLDNDGVPGIVATPSSGLVTSEAGTSTTFTVKLVSQPHDLVKITYSSTNLAEGTVEGNPCPPGVAPAEAAGAGKTGFAPTQGEEKPEAGKDSLCFSAEDARPNGSIQPNTLYFFRENWNVAQTLTITGVDDSLVDGDQPYQIKLDATTSSDADFAALAPVFVGVTNLDNDVPGAVKVSPLSRPVTSPDQPSTTFTLVLQTPPTAPVTIPLASSNPERGTIAPSSVTFTPANWNVPQTLTVTSNPANPGSYLILIGAAVSSDPAYNGIDVADIVIVNRAKTVDHALPAELYSSLRVTPDREYGVASTGFLTYSFEVKNSGPGRANSAFLRLPLDGSLEVATASFTDPKVWVEKIVTEGTEQYVQIRLTPFESNQTVTGTISFLPKSGVVPGTVVTERARVSWDDDTGTARSRASNAVHLTLVEGAAGRNETGGEVQFFSQAGKPVGSVLTLKGDFYAPDELVTLWYTTQDGKSAELGNARADGSGVLTFEVNFKNWPAGQPVTVAGRGNQSGVIGSTVMIVSKTTDNTVQTSGTGVTLRASEAREIKRLRQGGF